MTVWHATPCSRTMAPLRLRRKDHGVQAPALVDDQIFHPARGVGQERPDGTAPWRSPGPPDTGARPHRPRPTPCRPAPPSRRRTASSRSPPRVARSPRAPGAGGSGASKTSASPFVPRARTGRACSCVPAAAVNVPCTCPRVAAKRCTAPDPGPGSSTAARAKAAVGARTVIGCGWPRHQQARRRDLDQRPLAA